MQLTHELIDSIYREKVLRARATPVGAKLLAGAELFDDACVWMLGGIRAQNPEFTDEQVEAEMQRRLAIGRRLDERLIPADEMQ